MTSWYIDEVDPLRADLRRKAEHLVGRLRVMNVVDALQLGKKLQARRRLVSFRLNRKYRLVVAMERLKSGPYKCMKHETFDKHYGARGR